MRPTVSEGVESGHVRSWECGAMAAFQPFRPRRLGAAAHLQPRVDDRIRLFADDRGPSWLPRSGHFQRSIRARKRGLGARRTGSSLILFRRRVCEHQGRLPRGGFWHCSSR